MTVLLIGDLLSFKKETILNPIKNFNFKVIKIIYWI